MFIFGKWYWAVAFLLPTFMYFQILFNKHTVTSHNIHTLIAQSCPLTLQTSGLGGAQSLGPQSVTLSERNGYAGNGIDSNECVSLPL